MSFLKSKDLSETEFLGLMDAYDGGSSMMLLETPEWVKLERFSREKVDGRSLQGRVFNKNGELRWRKLGSDFRVVYLGSEDLAAPWLDDFSDELKELEPEMVKSILWGKRTKGQEWIEMMIPHRFNFPLETACITSGRVQLSVERWKDRATGHTHFSRYTGLEEVVAEGRN